MTPNHPQQKDLVLADIENSYVEDPDRDVGAVSVVGFNILGKQLSVGEAVRHINSITNIFKNLHGKMAEEF